jgi:hypothetical protein
MKLKTHLLTACGLLAAASVLLTACGDKKDGGGSSSSSGGTTLPPGETETIQIKYPAPIFQGTPVPAGAIPNLEKSDPDAVNKRDLKVPKGTTNVAQGKTVTSSDMVPVIGDLPLVTDGDTDGADGCYVELGPGVQWVQIDLGAEYNIWKILLWHFHKQGYVYFDVNVQVSNDPEFKTGVTTLYNSDHDDTAKLGKGSDPAYVETNHGRLIEGKGTKGRYVRFYSNGNTGNDLNHYVEAQVYGTPVDGAAPAAK